MSATHSYTPQADSLASMCIHFFRVNPDEELSLDDITEKFGRTRGNIHTLLRQALDAGLLERSRDADGDYIYRGGPATKRIAEIASKAEAPPPPYVARKVVKKGTPRASVELDFDSLVVEQGVPCARQVVAGVLKWDALFQKLASCGDSIQLPGHVKSAVAAAAYTYNKRGKGKYKVHKTGADSARIWRIA